MHAIILAAGMGNRLGRAHDGPKCLLDIDGRTLLTRHFEALVATGISHVTLCLGHRSEEIIEALPRDPGLSVLVHYNPLFMHGSAVSLWCARQTLLAGTPVVVMDADVLYHPRILSRLVDSAHADCFLLDRDFIPGDEPVKICVRDERMVEFGKVVPAGLAYDRVGESVGFFKFSSRGANELCRILAAHVADERRDLPHEAALRELALRRDSDIGIEDVTGLPWIEIDFPEDIERARRDILSRIEQTP